MARCRKHLYFSKGKSQGCGFGRAYQVARFTEASILFREVANMRSKPFIYPILVLAMGFVIVGVDSSGFCQEEPANPDRFLDYEKMDSGQYPMDDVFEMEAIEEEENRTPTPNSVTPILNVPAASFSSNGREPESTFYSVYLGYIRGESSSAGTGCVKAGITLPAGARIKFFWITYYDNDPLYFMSVWLMKTHYLDGLTTTIADADTIGKEPQASVRTMRSTFPPTDEFIDWKYSYSLKTCLTTENLRLFSVRIYYTLQDQTYFNKIVIDPTGAP
jgi:hypothetical protein